MKIQILGVGCPKCKKTTANAEEAVEKFGIDAEIEKIEKIDEITKFGVMMTPALAVDGEVKCSGRIPGVDEIVTWLENAED